MATIRELIAKFGVEVDTTPIARFNSAINQAKKNLRNLARLRIRGLDKEIKKALADSSKALNSPEVRENFRKNISKFDKFLNKAALALAGTITAGIAGALKSFKRFGEEEQATSRLRFQLSKIPGEFERTQQKIKDTIKDTGGLINKIDLLNAASSSFEIDTNPEAFRETIDAASKLSLILGRDVTDIASAFAQFRATGAVQQFQAFGFFTRQQLEILEKAGTELTDVGVRQRTNLLEELVTRNIDNINEEFTNFADTGIASAKRETTARDELIRVLGSETGLIKNVNGALVKWETNLAQNVEKTGGFFSGLGKTISQASEEQKKQLDIERIDREKRGITIFQQFLESFGISPDKKAKETFNPRFNSFLNNTRNTSNINQITNQVEVNIQAGPTEDSEQLTRSVTKGIEQALGTLEQQSSRGTLIRGKNQIVE